MSELQSATITTKENKNFQAVTFFIINDNVRLKVTTFKDLNDGLWITTAEAWRKISSCGGNVYETHEPDTDYSKKLDVHCEILRATEYLINATHAAVLNTFDRVYEEVFTFYN